MRGVLRINGLWEYVNGDKPKPATDPEEWMQKDGMALSLIQLCVNKSQLHHIRDAETSKPAWDDLQKIHEKSGPLQIYQLYKKLSHTKLGNQSLQQHFKTHVSSDLTMLVPELTEK